MVDQASISAVLRAAVSVLQAFTPDDDHLDAAEISRRTALSEGDAWAVIDALTQVRLLEQIGDDYRPSVLLFELGMRGSVEHQLVEVATPFLEDLYERTRETVHLGVRRNLDVVYIAKIGGHGFAEVPSRIGQRLPMYCTAIGKVLLAHAGEAVVAAEVDRGLAPRGPQTITDPDALTVQLAQIADAGVALEREESVAGLTCIAAPVIVGERVVAAISIAGPLYRFSPELHRATITAAAGAIGGLLAGRVARLTTTPK
jgi:DNA-binding IclR family transcriptional regulator